LTKKLFFETQTVKKGKLELFPSFNEKIYAILLIFIKWANIVFNKIKLELIKTML